MYSSFSLPFSLASLGFPRRRLSATLASVPIHETETASDQTSRRLHALIKLNHANHSIIYNDLRFHNHTPHILGSSYILGATPDQLTKVYEAEASSLEPWPNSPGEISEDDWRDYLGDKEYQRAYIDFFEDQLVEYGYDWKALLEHYLHSGNEPLITSLISGLGHPLIHLGYAYELGSRDVAIEALGLGTCFYSDLHKYIDDPSYTRPSTNKTTSVLTIFDRVRREKRLDGFLDHLGADNFDTLLAGQLEVVLEYWNSWDVTPATLQTCLFEAQKAAVATVVATPDHPPKPPPRDDDTSSAVSQNSTDAEGKYYDFFLLHGLTTSHAVRILIPLMPDSARVPLLRSWFLFALLAYMSQLRPRIDLTRITEFPLEHEGETQADTAKGKDASWKYVKDKALNGPHATDPHYVKPLRACLVAEEIWGDDPVEGAGTLAKYWRKAAVRMAGEFYGWGGFDANTENYKEDFY